MTRPTPDLIVRAELTDVFFNAGDGVTIYMKVGGLFVSMYLPDDYDERLFPVLDARAGSIVEFPLDIEVLEHHFLFRREEDPLLVNRFSRVIDVDGTVLLSFDDSTASEVF